MEPIHGSHEEDFITRIPENVITNILDRLPIQDAVRTGILSTNWRFNWTMISRLVFNHTFFKLGSEGKIDLNERNIITRILFQLKGSITRFHLVIPDYKTLNGDELSLWVMFLSRKGIKEFTLCNFHKTPLKLPSHLFSCLQLKHLSLHNCSFHPPPNFHGFPNLRSLHLIRVRFESFKCGELITRCPLLSYLSIVECILSSKVKLDEIAKLKNLVFLCLSSSILDITMPVTTFSIFQLVGFFPKLAILYFDFKKCKFLAESGAIKGVHTSFPRLKTLQLWSVDFGDDVIVSHVFEIIFCSPNLQTLKILALSKNHVPPPAICSSALDRKTMGQLRLRSVEFERLRGLDNEVCLIKSLLACSPFLKTMRIGLNSSSMIGCADGKFMFASKLLKLYRASPLVEIDLL